jgi:hypothetical protein
MQRSALKDGSIKLQAPSIKLQEPRPGRPKVPSAKHQAPSVKHQANKKNPGKFQAPSRTVQDPGRNFVAPRFLNQDTIEND